MKIYLASSWRNPDQPAAVAELRSAGHDVYDFRNPPGGIQNGFRWSELDPDWESWSATTYREKLKLPLAQQGFNSDFDGMKWADVGVLLLPCGRSAHLELGWMAGAEKRTIILTRDGQEPELMALLASEICVSMAEVIETLRKPDKKESGGLFEEFWNIYPKRKGANPKAPAKAKFDTIVKSGVQPEAIIAGLKTYSEEEKAKIGTEFIPQTTRWLNQRYWEDYQPTQEPTAANKSFFIREDTPAWSVWQKHLIKTTGNGSPCVNFGWYFPSPLPPE